MEEIQHSEQQGGHVGVCEECYTSFQRARVTSHQIIAMGLLANLYRSNLTNGHP